MKAKVAKSPQHQAITQGEAPLAERLEQRLAAAPTLTVAATTDPADRQGSGTPADGNSRRARR
jgi:hypothetical protein